MTPQFRTLQVTLKLTLLLLIKQYSFCPPKLIRILIDFPIQRMNNLDLIVIVTDFFLRYAFKLFAVL